MFASHSNSHAEIPTHRHDGIWRWDLWEMIMSQIEAPMNGSGALITENPEGSLAPFTCGESQRSAPQKRALIRACPGWHPDLALPASTTLRHIYFVYKPPFLEYFVLAAWTNWNRNTALSANKSWECMEVVGRGFVPSHEMKVLVAGRTLLIASQSFSSTCSLAFPFVFIIFSLSCTST